MEKIISISIGPPTSWTVSQNGTVITFTANYPEGFWRTGKIRYSTPPEKKDEEKTK